MNIKLFITSIGQVLGEVVEETDIGFLVENPVNVTPSANGVSFFPILAFTQEKQLWIKRTALDFVSQSGQGLEPAVELRNHYSSQFGSGVQILIGN